MATSASASASASQKRHLDTYVNEPLDVQKAIHGNSRKPSDAPPEIQQKCIDIIIEEGNKLGFPVRDIAYYIAIAKHESGFNPDAANANSTASGIAQVTESTAEKYGINDTNRFNARDNIRAGIRYFFDIKKRIATDYGRADGDYEPLIYFLYHYGEFYHYQDRKHAKFPYSLDVLQEKYPSKLKEAVSVLADGANLEKILSGKHALQIQLRDVLGKPLPNRQVVVVTPKPVKKAISTPVLPSTESTLANLDASSQVNAASSSSAAPPTNYLDAIPTIASSSAPDSQSSSDKTEGNVALDDRTSAPLNEERLNIKLVTTDIDGNIPPVISDTEQPVLILIPREYYPEYADAVTKLEFSEEAIEHQIVPRDPIRDRNKRELGLEAKSLGEHATQSTSAPSNTDNAAAIKNTAGAPLTAASSASKAALSKSTPGVPSQPPTPPANQTQEKVIKRDQFTLEDAERACKEMGWDWACNGLTYIKQFFTKPKLPEAPFDQGKAGPPQVRVQGISSSGNSLDKKKLEKNKGKVTTKEDTAAQEVRADPNAPWMKFALEEQSAGVMEYDGDNLESPIWQALNADRNKEIDALKDKTRKLEKEKRKHIPSQETVIALENEIEAHKKKIEGIVAKQSEIESKNTNPRISEYLRSTGLASRTGNAGGDASSDETAWCGGFVNWVLSKAGHKGPTGAQRAANWQSWGIALAEPKYGAITVVGKIKGTVDGAAQTPSGSHVGFFVGERTITRKTKKKDGTVEEKTIKYVKLLGGNQRGSLRADGVTESEFDLTRWGISAMRWPPNK